MSLGAGERSRPIRLHQLEVERDWRGEGKRGGKKEKFISILIGR